MVDVPPIRPLYLLALRGDCGSIAIKGRTKGAKNAHAASLQSLIPLSTFGSMVCVAAWCDDLVKIGGGDPELLDWVGAAVSGTQTICMSEWTSIPAASRLTLRNRPRVATIMSVVRSG